MFARPPDFHKAFGKKAMPSKAVAALDMEPGSNVSGMSFHVIP